MPLNWTTVDYRSWSATLSTSVNRTFRSSCQPANCKGRRFAEPPSLSQAVSREELDDEVPRFAMPRVDTA